MGKNVAVFVDVANIFYAAKAAGVDIDYVTLLKSATAGRDLVRAYAYTGLDPDNENQRNFHDFLRRSNYKVVSKDIRKYGDGKVKANLDIELVVDMMKTARNLDIAIVVSGDGDFAPAIRAVQEQGVRVEVISFRGNTSSDLIDVADQFTDIVQLARVEKGSRSGRRVAEDEADLSMTEVPDKLTEGSGIGRGGRGRGRGRTTQEEPVAIGRGRGRGASAAAPCRDRRGRLRRRASSPSRANGCRAPAGLTEADLAAAEVFTLDDASGEGPPPANGELARSTVEPRTASRAAGAAAVAADAAEAGVGPRSSTVRPSRGASRARARAGREPRRRRSRTRRSSRRDAPRGRRRSGRSGIRSSARRRRRPRPRSRRIARRRGLRRAGDPGVPDRRAAARRQPWWRPRPRCPRRSIGLPVGHGPRALSVGAAPVAAAVAAVALAARSGGRGINRYPDVSARPRPSDPAPREDRGYGRPGPGSRARRGTRASHGATFRRSSRRCFGRRSPRSRCRRPAAATSARRGRARVRGTASRRGGVPGDLAAATGPAASPPPGRRVGASRAGDRRERRRPARTRPKRPRLRATDRPAAPKRRTTRAATAAATSADADAGSAARRPRVRQRPSRRAARKPAAARRPPRRPTAGLGRMASSGRPPAPKRTRDAEGSDHRRPPDRRWTAPGRGDNRSRSKRSRRWSAGSAPHAILLAGPDGVGKTTLALDLAAGLLCEADPERRPCRACRACRMVEHGGHPDLHRLGPVGPGRQVVIGGPEARYRGIRDLIAELALMPVEGRARVAIVDGADRMNEDAQSALLKTLEEPPAGVVIVLCADQETRLLPTVRSRCARIRLGLVGSRDIEAIVGDHDLADPPLAARLGRLAAGRPGLALAYARAPDAVLIRAELSRVLLDLTSAGAAARLAAVRAAIPRALALVAALASADDGRAGVNASRAGGARTPRERHCRSAPADDADEMRRTTARPTRRRTSRAIRPGLRATTGRRDPDRAVGGRGPGPRARRARVAAVGPRSGAAGGARRGGGRRSIATPSRPSWTEPRGARSCSRRTSRRSCCSTRWPWPGRAPAPPEARRRWRVSPSPRSRASMPG